MDVDAPVTDEVVELGELSDDQHRFLAPRRGRLDPDVDHAVEWTAWTLEPGAWRAGIGWAGVGVLPRVMVSTSPVLAALGTLDVAARWNALHFGPVDVAAQWRFDHLALGDLVADSLAVGGIASIELAPTWSVHAGLSYGELHAEGLPTRLPWSLRPLASEELLSGLVATANGLGIDPTVEGKGTLVRLATNLHFNRRDGLAMQASTVLFGELKADLGDDVAPEVLDALTWLAPGTAGGQIALDPVAKGPSWVVSVSYTASLGNLDLRAGAGTSATPLAWALQANDIALRGGGATRREERRMRKGWKAAPDELQADDAAPATVASAP